MARRGQRELEELYRRRYDDFARVARAVTASDALAHEAVQEGFARALRSLGTFRGDAPLEAWVWRIVLNAAHDAREPDHAELLVDAPAADAPASANGSSSDFTGWIATLPERQRLAVFLRYQADLDYRAIAATLGVEIGTVSATLHAAHEALRRSLEEVLG
jgi:RNA polymerase sigma-70 factor (ECF subfamily)